MITLESEKNMIQKWYIESNTEEIDKESYMAQEDLEPKQCLLRQLL